MYEITFKNPCVDSGLVLSEIPVEVGLSSSYIQCYKNKNKNKNKNKKKNLLLPIKGPQWANNLIQ